jgi:hypothetical protein
MLPESFDPTMGSYCNPYYFGVISTKDEWNVSINLNNLVYVKDLQTFDILEGSKYD